MHAVTQTHCCYSSTQTKSTPTPLFYYRKHYFPPFHLLYTLQLRVDGEKRVKGLFQGCRLTPVVSASLVLIYTVGGPLNSRYRAVCKVVLQME